MRTQLGSAAWGAALLWVAACSTGMDNNLRQNSYTPYGTGAAVTGTPSFSAIQQEILMPLCSSCHDSATSTAGFAVNSYQSVEQFVRPGSPQNSPLYQVLYNRQMPPNGNGLTATQLNQIATWIQQGALDN